MSVTIQQSQTVYLEIILDIKYKKVTKICGALYLEVSE
jgi:hypothetical protein